MSVQRAYIYVDGMTCPACEARISKSLMAIEGVIRVEAHVEGGKVEVEFDDALTSPRAIKTVIERIGYTVREKKDASTRIALGIGLLLAAGYFVASASGAFSALPKVDASIGYATLFVVGLLTSIHCIAMCGGIALSQSIQGLEARAQAVVPGKLGRLSPALLYNAGRVFAYTIIGGAVGALGAAFSFSPVTKAIIAGIAGAFMVYLGLKMLGLLKSSPRLVKLVPVKIREFWSRFSAGLHARSPFAVGLLNGLMPCGPLQTMQLYALGTGSALAGALSMLIFSLGTAPLMLFFGMTAAFLPRSFVPIMVKASAVLVVFLGLMTFGRAAALAGMPLPSVSMPSFAQGGSVSALPLEEVADRSSPKNGILRARRANGEQSVVTVFKDGRYLPFAVQAGLPLKWTIRIKAEDISGCNTPLVVPAYGIRKELVAGDNLIEFTPAKEGTISYSCWMGMITSRITVLRDLGG